MLLYGVLTSTGALPCVSSTWCLLQAPQGPFKSGAGKREARARYVVEQLPLDVTSVEAPASKADPKLGVGGCPGSGRGAF
jgi:hypothetical protein